MIELICCQELSTTFKWGEGVEGIVDIIIIIIVILLIVIIASIGY